MNNQQYQQVTGRIIAMMERGVRPWQQSWASHPGGGRPLRHDGTKYRGANVVNLWAAGMVREFTSPYWLTYKRAAELGAQVRKGAKSELAFYVGTARKKVEVDGQETDQTIPFLKAYCVFNADEIEGLAPHFYAPQPSAPLDPTARVANVDRFIASTGCSIKHGGGKAFYHPSTDDIHMPDFEAFDSAAAYYSVLLHEATHWTGAKHRLDRSKGKLFGDPDYAFEELIAELGSAYLCADLGVTAKPREDHASYVKSWLKALRDDNRAIFRAASLAERAAEYLHKAQEQPEALAA